MSCSQNAKAPCAYAVFTQLMYSLDGRSKCYAACNITCGQRAWSACEVCSNKLTSAQERPRYQQCTKQLHRQQRDSVCARHCRHDCRLQCDYAVNIKIYTSMLWKHCMRWVHRNTYYGNNSAHQPARSDMGIHIHSELIAPCGRSHRAKLHSAI